MRRMLTGATMIVIIVALSLYACRRSRGPIDPDTQGGVAHDVSPTTASGSQVAEEMPTHASPPIMGGEQDVMPLEARSLSYSYMGFWELKKRDGTTLRLWVLTYEEEGTVVAYLRQAGKQVMVEENCRAAFSPDSLMVICMEAKYVDGRKARLAYKPDRLLFKQTGSNDFDVVEIPDDLKGERVPVEVIYHERYP